MGKGYTCTSFLGYEYEEEPKWFDWFDGYRATTCDYTVDHEIIPRLKEQEVISKLGTYQFFTKLPN